jgi:hypothetical protein
MSIRLSTRRINGTTSACGGQYGLMKLADKIMKTNPTEYGYIYGLMDGQKNARDATSACGRYNSTADNDQCSHGYSSGFKKGCESYHFPPDPSPEYGQCRTFNYVDDVTKNSDSMTTLKTNSSQLDTDALNLKEEVK